MIKVLDSVAAAATFYNGYGWRVGNIKRLSRFTLHALNIFAISAFKIGQAAVLYLAGQNPVWVVRAHVTMVKHLS